MLTTMTMTMTMTMTRIGVPAAEQALRRLRRLCG
jgi:hypothetical protein